MIKKNTTATVNRITMFIFFFLPLLFFIHCAPLAPSSSSSATSGSGGGGVAVVVSKGNTSSMANNKKLIEKINSFPNGTWKAVAYPQFEGKSISYLARTLLGSYLKPPKKYENMTTVAALMKRINSSHLPEYFDSREAWPNCVHPIRDQGNCASCWALSSTDVLSDRFCIETNGRINVILSPQYLVSCDDTDYGCSGGMPSNAWNFLSLVGTCTENCFPYSSGSGNPPECRYSCIDGLPMKKFRADGRSIRYFYNDVDATMLEIMAYGPVQSGLKVYEDFLQYSSGVYRHIYGGFAGGHSIKILGWGRDSYSNLPYWIVANSWGRNWGMNGFFWILRGSNECDIEANVIAGRPSFNTLNL